MNWRTVKSLEDIKEYIDKHSTIPSKIQNNELLLLVNNADFETFQKDLGDNILIKIKNLSINDDNAQFTVSAEKDGTELISISDTFDTSINSNTSSQIWDKIIVKLIENKILLPNEVELVDEAIYSNFKTKLWTNERVVMKCLKDVFYDFTYFQLRNIYNEILNDKPGFWINITFIHFENHTDINIIVMANANLYSKSYTCDIFNLKETLTEIRNQLEKYNFCKKRK